MTDEERRKRLERYGGILLNTPEVDESMRQFQGPAQAPAQSPDTGPTPPSAPRYTRTQLREDYPDVSSLMGDIFKDKNEKTKEFADYHKKSARADALGRAIGSLGGFVSAHMGGPVGPHQPGRSREHMDRYEQLLGKYEDDKATQEMLALQELVRDERMFSDILRGQDDRDYQIQRRDYEYGRGRTDQLTDRDDQRSYAESRRDPEFEDWRRRTDHQYEWQRKLQRESDARRLAQQATGRTPSDDSYTVRYEGRDMPISEAHAFEILSRTPDNVLMSVFGTKDVGNLDFAVVGPKMSTLLARVGSDMFIPVPVYDESDKLVGHRLETRTSATSPPKADEMGEIVAGTFDAIMGDLVTPDQVEEKMIQFMDEKGGHNMSLPQARQYARMITEGLFSPPERDGAGNIVSHPLQEIPLPRNMRLPQDWPRNMERNFYNLLTYYHGRKEPELTRKERRRAGRDNRRETIRDAGGFTSQ